MVEVVKNNIDKITAACKEMEVKSLYLFGSGTRDNDFTKSSDLDFLFQVHVNDEGLSVSKYDYFDVCFKLEEITGRKVDLVYEKKVTNPYFLKQVNAEKIKLYEA
jgi:uncharacterized protein